MSQMGVILKEDFKKSYNFKPFSELFLIRICIELRLVSPVADEKYNIHFNFHVLEFFEKVVLKNFLDPTYLEELNLLSYRVHTL